MTKFCSALYLENLLRNIFAKLNLRGGVSCMPAALLFSYILLIHSLLWGVHNSCENNFPTYNIVKNLKWDRYKRKNPYVIIEGEMASEG